MLIDNDTVRFKNEVQLSHCPACLATKLEFYAISCDFHYKIPGKFATERCVQCGTVFLNPMPSTVDLGVLYPDDYYSYQAPIRESRFRRLVRVIFRYPRLFTLPDFTTPGVMLDVGCGAGHYLLEMQHQGWKVFGVELNKGAAAAGMASGLDIRGSELCKVGFDAEYFDFVRSNHSFEHIPNPQETLKEMHRILKKDGRLFIGIPCFDGLWPRIFGKYWWNFGLPVHTFNYTKKGICTLLEQNGFIIDRFAYNSDYSGLVGSIQIWWNAKKNMNRSDGAILHNRMIRFPAHYLSKFVDMIRQGDCIEIIALKK